MIDFLKDCWHAVGTYFLFLIMAFAGGTANYISKVKSNHHNAFSVLELLGEWVVSGFSGMKAAFLMIDQGCSLLKQRKRSIIDV